MHALAFDLGGSHATCALVNETQVLAVRHLEFDALDGLAPRLPEFAAAARAVSSEAKAPLRQCSGCTLSFPGIVDSGANRVLQTFGKYDDAKDFDLTGWCRESLGLPLAMENDGRLALLGERHAGAARGCDDVVMLTFGTGIGMGALIGGRLVNGKHALAGTHAGHFPIRLHGRQCYCGGLGCAETEAATWSLPQVVEEFAAEMPDAARASPLPVLAAGVSGGRRLGFNQIFSNAREGDPLAVAVRDHCLRVWASCAVTAALAYDAELVVLGGGVMASADEVLPPIREHVRRHAFAPWGTVRVVAAELGNHAALLGALPLLRSVGVIGAPKTR